MNPIELSNEEQEVFAQVLQNSLAALELEIQHTDHAEFKNLLKRRREVIRGLVAKTASAVAAAA